MINLTITENQADQRLDRFLKKYFDNAPLSHIYKMIRKDVKVNGKRSQQEAMLKAGDVLSIYISQEQAEALMKPKRRVRAKRQFSIAYEDENLLIAEKPFGLLTHGDKTEKKNHLANQVVDYLIETGAYDPRSERTFTPAPAGRLDRNTTGLVMFGKNAQTLQDLNRRIREKDLLGKFYLTIVAGKLEKPLILKDRMTKDQAKNMIAVVPLAGEGKLMETHVRPLESARYMGRWFSLVEVEIITGRTHQIRAHLAQAGYPVIGDTKYGARQVNEQLRRTLGLNTHLLHAWRLVFRADEVADRVHRADQADQAADQENANGNAQPGSGTQEHILDYMAGKSVEAALPAEFAKIREKIFLER